jgi:hypothetical protein
MKTLKITFIVLALTLSACNSNPFGKPDGDPTASPEGSAPTPAPENNGAGGEGEGTQQPPPEPQVNFQIIKSQVLNNCVGCHARFQNYDSVVRELSSIESAVVENRMPPRGPLRVDIKELLTKWIQLGAPQ